MNLFKHLLLALYLTGLGMGCSGTSTNAVDGSTGDGTKNDVRESTYDARDAGEKVDTESDLDDGERVVTPTGHWPIQSRCQGTTTYSDVPMISPPPERATPVPTREDTVGRFSGRDVNSVHGFYFPTEYRAGQDLAASLFMEESDVFRVSMVFWFAKYPERTREWRHHVALLVNYRPVEWRLVHWKDDRSEVIEERTGTSFILDMNSDFHSLDLEIDPSQVETGRYHEVALISQLVSEDGLAVQASARRFQVFWGGQDRTHIEHPCFTEPLRAQPTDQEWGLYGARRLGWAEHVLFPESATEEEDLEEPIRVGPADEVSVRWSYMSDGGVPRKYVAVPFLDGEPIDEQFYFEDGGEWKGQLLIDERRTFVRDAPAPGKHQLMFVMWPDPFAPFEDGPDQRIDGVWSGTGLPYSNIVDVHVEGLLQ